jgi:excisionase family DNA binding protein
MTLVKLLTPEDVAELCGVTRKTVYRWIKQDHLRAIRFGTLLRIHPNELNRFIDEQSDDA